MAKRARCSRFFRGYLVIAACGLVTSGGAALAAGDTPDATIDTAQRLIKRAVAATKDDVLAKNPDAGQILTALRTAQDPTLVPIFNKIRKSTVPENQVFGMVATAIISKDPKGVDLKLIFASKDQSMAGAAIASLIDAQVLTLEQLTQLMNDAPDASQRAMAAGELNARKELKDRTALKTLLNDPKEIVRYYVAVSMLDSKDAGEISSALAVLKKLAADHDLRQAPVQALMLVRVQKENLQAAVPWAAQIAADEANDEGLRYTALSSLLTLKSPEGPSILGDMLQKQTETAQQVKLGLISTEFADQLKPATLGPLVKSKSSLVHTIGSLAEKAAGRPDGVESQALLSLLKEGHPIVLDWALAFSDRTDPERRLMLRTAVINQATIVDNQRERDYERAVLAAEKILNEDGPAGRKAVVALLKSDNRAVVEATLAGIYRSKGQNQSELVMPIWDGLTRITSMEMAANYAALILAREGHKEPLNWLHDMVAGGSAQGPGFRALAGWYYAKLKGQADALLNYVLAD